jgi:hypothetical protein
MCPLSFPAAKHRRATEGAAACATRRVRIALEAETPPSHPRHAACGSMPERHLRLDGEGGGRAGRGQRQALARGDGDGARGEGGEDGGLEGRPGDVARLAEEAARRHDLERPRRALPQEGDLGVADGLLVLDLDVVEHVADEPGGARGLGRGEGAPLVDDPLRVHPQLHALVRLRHPGPEGVLLRVLRHGVPGPLHAEAVDQPHVRARAARAPHVADRGVDGRRADDAEVGVAEVGPDEPVGRHRLHRDAEVAAPRRAQADAPAAQVGGGGGADVAGGDLVGLGAGAGEADEEAVDAEGADVAPRVAGLDGEGGGVARGGDGEGHPARVAPRGADDACGAAVQCRFQPRERSGEE